jgi:hypothetical protein
MWFFMIGLRSWGGGAMSSRLLSDEAEVRLVERYKAGEGSGILADLFGTNKTTICNILRRHGVAPRSPRAARRADYPLNENAFGDLANAEARYWIGFLLADGCIRHMPDQEPMISVSLKAGDIDHLTKLAEFLGSYHAPKVETNRQTKYTRIQFSSAAIARRLGNFGLGFLASLDAMRIFGGGSLTAMGG